MCRGEIFFARPCAFDAPSTTRCDRAPALRRRITDVRAKNISPLRAPSMRNRPTINNRRTPNRGTRPNVTTHRMCRGEIFFARPCAIDAPSPARYERAPAMRRRTMDVRAKNIFRPYVCQRCPIDHRSPGRARWVPQRPAAARALTQDTGLCSPVSVQPIAI